MANYVVDLVHPTTRPWSNDNGQFVEYVMDLKGGDGVITTNCKWSRKTDSPAPKTGDQLDGDLTPDERFGGFKFKKASSGGGGRDYQPKDDHPKKSAAMGRAHAQEMALRYAQAKAGGRLSEDFKLDHLVPLIDWFYSDVQKARQAA